MNPNMTNLADNFTKLATQAAIPVKDMVTRLGRVSPDYSGGQALIYFDGESQAQAGSGRPVSCIDTYVPAANQRVVLIGSGSTWMILGGVAGTAIGSGTISPSSFGAKFDGVTDDTAAIQTAINSAFSNGGGVVELPAGKAVISTALVVKPRVSIIGAGPEVSVILQQSETEHGMIIEGEVVPDEGRFSWLTLEGFGLRGPGEGTGVGIQSETQWFVDINKVHVYDFGSHGVRLETNLVSTLKNVLCRDNGGDGFHVDDALTSTSFISCFARSNTGHGYYVDGYETAAGSPIGLYTSFVSCASDHNGMNNYHLYRCIGLTFTSCGSEWIGTTGSPGNGFYFESCNGATLTSCFSIGQVGAGIKLVTSYKISAVSCAFNSFSVGRAFDIDSASSATIISPVIFNDNVSTPSIYNNKTIRILPDDDNYANLPVIDLGGAIFRSIDNEIGQVEDTLRVKNTHNVAYESCLVAEAKRADQYLLSGEISGESYGRFFVQADGKIILGSGSAPGETQIYRGAANQVRVNGTWRADVALRAGQFEASDRPSASALGTGAQIYDYVLSKPLWSDGSVWRDAAGTAV